MHELSLMQSVVEIVDAAARAQGFTRVLEVRLEVGRLAGVDAEALRFCFDVATASSCAAGSELVIDEVPGEGRCSACGATGSIESRYDPCARCGALGLEITRGLELRVKSLEVDG